MKAAMLIIASGITISCPGLADITANDATDRIAVHFEASSSRLRAEDADSLTRFVSRTKNVPGAKLAVLIPNSAEPARIHFMAARIAELERHIRTFSDAEFQREPGTTNGDFLWLTIVLPDREIAPRPIDLIVSSEPPPAPEPPGPSALIQPIVSPSDLQLTDWVVRGAKHPIHGPAYAYVAKIGSEVAPHEVVESQTDKDLGLIKEINLSYDGHWIVRTEIGWIGQAAP